MDRAQRVDEKNGVICLVMFTPGVIVIKMSKMAHFLYFLLITVGFFLYFSPQKVIQLQSTLTTPFSERTQ